MSVCVCVCQPKSVFSYLVLHFYTLNLCVCVVFIVTECVQVLSAELRVIQRSNICNLKNFHPPASPLNWFTAEILAPVSQLQPNFPPVVASKMWDINHSDRFICLKTALNCNYSSSPAIHSFSLQMIGGIAGAPLTFQQASSIHLIRTRHSVNKIQNWKFTAGCISVEASTVFQKCKVASIVLFTADPSLDS